jgi:hypothetical protein
VGEITSHGDVWALRYYKDEAEFRNLNDGKQVRDATALGYSGFPAFALEQECHRIGVADVFMRRLPPRSRSDFEAYKARFCLHPGLDLSDFALLAHTEAKLPSDGFSVVDPLDGSNAPRDLMLEIAGFRYYAKDITKPLAVEDDAEILIEPGNKHDKDAVQICVRGEKVGNINRLQTHAFHRWLAGYSVEALIERLNGSADHPRAFTFIKVRPKVMVAA